MNPDPVPLGTENTLRVQKSLTRCLVLIKTTDFFDFSKISIVDNSSEVNSPRGVTSRGVTFCLSFAALRYMAPLARLTISSKLVKIDAR